MYANVHSFLPKLDAIVTRFSWSEPVPIADLRYDLNDSPLLCEILARRGLSEHSAVSAFISPRIEDLADPLLLPDMCLAVQRIRAAVDSGKQIAIFGDYDVDGITSTAVLKRALEMLGARTTTQVPHREKDGYGLNIEAIDRMAGAGASLLIALDCGTSDQVELERAQAAGMETVVVDHHHVVESNLPGTAFVSPQRPDSDYPFRDLAAVGVTYHLARVLIGEEKAMSLLPLVALGTVADVVPLVGENRVLASLGLRHFDRDAVVGLRCLALSSGLDPAHITSRHCGFVLGPRINAAGRMADPQIALELLLTDDEDRADELASELGRLNAKRQRIVEEMLYQAEGRAMRDGTAAPFLIVGAEDWNVGLVGLVAGRLSERFNRPSVALSRGQDVSRGSARSIEGFNIVEALSACKDILVEHGGHSQAAGLTVLTKDLVELESRLIDLTMKAFGGDPPAPTLVIDAEISGRELNVATARTIELLEPFGQGNPAPRLMICSVMVSSPRRTRNGKHLQFQVDTAGGSTAKAIFFDGGDELSRFLNDQGPYDLVFELKVDGWRGRDEASLEVLDYRPSQSTSNL